MINHPSTANLRLRTHLELRRAQLAAEIEACRAQALDLWQKAWLTELGGGDATSINHHAIEREEACSRLAMVLAAIDAELASLTAEL